MSTPNKKEAPARPESDLVISVVLFRTPVDIGSYGADSWSLENAATSLLHGKVRVEQVPVGLRFIYAAGDVYQRHTVPWGNIADVVEVPRSQLKETTRAFLDAARPKEAA